MLRALILGIVQGLTEFLPISSSAHLSIVPALLGYRTPSLAFEVLLHFGTLAAVVAYYAKDLWRFVLCLVAPGRLGAARARAYRRLLLLLALASVPAAVAGFLLEDWAGEQTSRPLRAAVWLVVTTSVLIAAELYARRRPPAPAAPVAAPSGPGALRATAAASPGTARDGDSELESLPTGKALVIGVAQALALVPGTSRSGVTISAGLFAGVAREVAARFSFLLSIPAILGAGVLKLGDLDQGVESGAELAVGCAAAAVSGFLAVSLLIRMLRTRTLWPFVWYRLAAGALFIALLTR